MIRVIVGAVDILHKVIDAVGRRNIVLFVSGLAGFAGDDKFVAGGVSVEAHIAFDAGDEAVGAAVVNGEAAFAIEGFGLLGEFAVDAAGFGTAAG